MKREHTITAPADGGLTQLPVVVGPLVEVGAVLARVEMLDSAIVEENNNE
jgi:propionyl-CoA carboxylase alpha chain